MRSCLGVRFIGFVLSNGGDSSGVVRNVEDFHVLNGFGKKAGKSVAARARGELLSLCSERIGISLKFLHRVTGGAFHSESSGALKDVLSEVAAWTEHDKWCASRSEE